MNFSPPPPEAWKFLSAKARNSKSGASSNHLLEAATTSQVHIIISSNSGIDGKIKRGKNVTIRQSDELCKVSNLVLTAQSAQKLVLHSNANFGERI